MAFAGFSNISLIWCRHTFSRGTSQLKPAKWANVQFSHFRANNSNQLRHFRGNKQKSDGVGGPVTPFQMSRTGMLLKPFGFTIAFSCCSFAGAAIWQYETMRKRALALFDQSTNWLRQQLDPPTKFALWRAEINKYWNALSEGQRMAVIIIGVNTMVFLLWRVPIASPMMMKYFCSNPAAKAVCWPMLFSTFSHYSLWHLVLNMYVFFSFSTGIVHVLGREQFLAMYLSSGIFASFASILHKSVTLKAGFSLGASGCIMGVLGFFCTQFPNSQLGIAFVPHFHFNADTGLKAIILFDTLGCVLGWKLFDHAAHLGGVFFGIAYALWGRQFIWERREPFLRWWNSIRGGSTN